MTKTSLEKSFIYKLLNQQSDIQAMNSVWIIKCWLKIHCHSNLILINKDLLQISNNLEILAVNSKLCYSKYKEKKNLTEKSILKNSTKADQQIKKKEFLLKLQHKIGDLKILTLRCILQSRPKCILHQRR